MQQPANEFVIEIVYFAVFFTVLLYFVREILPLFERDIKLWKDIKNAKSFGEGIKPKQQKALAKEYAKMTASWGAFSLAFILLAGIVKLPDNPTNVFLVSFFKGAEHSPLQAFFWGAFISVCLYTATGIKQLDYVGFTLRFCCIFLITITTVLGLSVGIDAPSSIYALMGKISAIVVAVYLKSTMILNELAQKGSRKTSSRTKSVLKSVVNNAVAKVG